RSPTECVRDVTPLFGRRRSIGGEEFSRRLRAGGPMSRRGWLLFLTMGAIWGVPYMMIKVAVEYVTPASLVFLRCAIGAVLLVPIAAALGHLRAVLPRWRPLLVFAAVEVAMPWLLLSAAEQRLSSSLSGL